MQQQLMFRLRCLEKDFSNHRSCLFLPWHQSKLEKTLQKHWTSCDDRCSQVCCYFATLLNSIHGIPILKKKGNQLNDAWITVLHVLENLYSQIIKPFLITKFDNSKLEIHFCSCFLAKISKKLLKYISKYYLSWIHLP